MAARVPRRSIGRGRLETRELAEQTLLLATHAAADFHLRDRCRCATAEAGRRSRHAVGCLTPNLFWTHRTPQEMRLVPRVKTCHGRRSAGSLQAAGAMRW